MTDHQIETRIGKRDLVALAERPIVLPGLQWPGALECRYILIQRYNGTTKSIRAKTAGSRTQIQHALTGLELLQPIMHRIYCLIVTIWEAASTASASSAVNCSVLAEWFMEQNLGPHMEQKAASLKPSSGSVSSCIASAVSGSSDNSNCFRQSKR